MRGSARCATAACSTPCSASAARKAAAPSTRGEYGAGGAEGLCGLGGGGAAAGVVAARGASRRSALRPGVPPRWELQLPPFVPPLRIAPALLRQASYGTIKIGIYQSLKRLFVDRLEGL